MLFIKLKIFNIFQITRHYFDLMVKNYTNKKTESLNILFMQNCTLTAFFFLFSATLKERVYRIISLLITLQYFLIIMCLSLMGVWIQSFKREKILSE